MANELIYKVGDSDGMITDVLGGGGGVLRVRFDRLGECKIPHEY